MGKISFAQKIKNLFKTAKIDEEFFESLTDSLIEGDIGAKNAFEITELLKEECKKNHIENQNLITAELGKIISSYIKLPNLSPCKGKTNIWMILGVNGVGKTTTTAKLANFYKKNGLSNIILAAADTFRAAAIEQLQFHGEKIGVRVISHDYGSDPAAVVFDSAQASRSKGAGLVLADTAGRLHNKDNLVRELQKIDKICRQKADEDCYKRILVLDAASGQNAFRQAEVFNEAVGIDALILTKYDSTAKGGNVISISKELGIATAFVCTGEKYEDISQFEPSAYVKEFLGL